MRKPSVVGDAGRRCVLTFVLLLSAQVVASAQSQDAFFDDSVVQDVHLSIRANDWLTLKARFDDNTYYPADFRWRGATVRNVGLRSRGTGTRSGIKPGLRVDFNRYLSNQQFLGLRAVELKNMYTDPSLVRESVAMKLYERLGLNVPREVHVRLFVNGDFAGVYVLVEAIDRRFVERSWGSAEADLERGGYLFEYRWQFPYGFDDLGPDLRVYAPLFEPKTRETDAAVRIYGPIEDLVRTVNTVPDGQVVAMVGPLVDLPMLVRQLAVELFTVEWDGLTGDWGTNNFYVYRFARDGHAQFIPWDRDHAFTWDAMNAADFLDAPLTLRVDTNVLARRMLQDAGLRQIFLESLARCVALSEEPGTADARGWLVREVERQTEAVREAVAADSVYPFSMVEFKTDVDYLKLFAEVRPRLVACRLAATERGLDEGICRLQARE